MFNHLKNYNFDTLTERLLTERSLSFPVVDGKGSFVHIRLTDQSLIRSEEAQSLVRALASLLIIRTESAGSVSDEVRGQTKSITEALSDLESQFGVLIRTYRQAEVAALDAGGFGEVFDIVIEGKEMVVKVAREYVEAADVVHELHAAQRVLTLIGANYFVPVNESHLFAVQLDSNTGTILYRPIEVKENMEGNLGLLPGERVAIIQTKGGKVFSKVPVADLTAFRKIFTQLGDAFSKLETVGIGTTDISANNILINVATLAEAEKEVRDPVIEIIDPGNYSYMDLDFAQVKILIEKIDTLGISDKVQLEMLLKIITRFQQVIDKNRFSVWKKFFPLLATSPNSLVKVISALTDKLARIERNVSQRILTKIFESESIKEMDQVFLDRLEDIALRVLVDRGQVIDWDQLLPTVNMIRPPIVYRTEMGEAFNSGIFNPALAIQDASDISSARLIDLKGVHAWGLLMLLINKLGFDLSPIRIGQVGGEPSSRLSHAYATSNGGHGMVVGSLYTYINSSVVPSEITIGEFYDAILKGSLAEELFKDESKAEAFLTLLNEVTRDYWETQVLGMRERRFVYADANKLIERFLAILQERPTREATKTDFYVEV